MNNPNYPAYPADRRISENYMDSGGYGRSREVTLNQGGMTIRQQFVLAAMQGLCASREWVGACDATQLEIEAGIAIHACRIADAALAEEARTRSKA